VKLAPGRMLLLLDVEEAGGGASRVRAGDHLRVTPGERLDAEVAKVLGPGRLLLVRP